MVTRKSLCIRLWFMMDERKKKPLLANFRYFFVETRHTNSHEMFVFSRCSLFFFWKHNVNVSRTRKGQCSRWLLYPNLSQNALNSNPEVQAVNFPFCWPCHLVPICRKLITKVQTSLYQWHVYNSILNALSMSIPMSCIFENFQFKHKITSKDPFLKGQERYLFHIYDVSGLFKLSR